MIDRLSTGKELHSFCCWGDGLFQVACGRVVGDVVSLDCHIGELVALGPLMWLIGFLVGTHP